LLKIVKENLRIKKLVIEKVLNKDMRLLAKLISQLKLNIQNQKMECLYEKNRNVL
jgi:hypothetical protein